MYEREFSFQVSITSISSMVFFSIVDGFEISGNFSTTSFDLTSGMIEALSDSSYLDVSSYFNST
jgi:hypothetical protein